MTPKAPVQPRFQLDLRAWASPLIIPLEKTISHAGFKEIFGSRLPLPKSQPSLTTAIDGRFTGLHPGDRRRPPSDVNPGQTPLLQDERLTATGLRWAMSAQHTECRLLRFGSGCGLSPAPYWSCSYCPRYLHSSRGLGGHVRWRQCRVEEHGSDGRPHVLCRVGDSRYRGPEVTSSWLLRRAGRSPPRVIGSRHITPLPKEGTGRVLTGR
jgi:hypothetical protein